MIVNVNTW